MNLNHLSLSQLFIYRQVAISLNKIDLVKFADYEIDKRIKSLSDQ